MVGTSFLPFPVDMRDEESRRFAGVALYIMTVIQPALGHALTVKAFILTVLAGIGSVPGGFLAAILLGVTEALTVTVASSALQELAGMVLFLLVHFLPPNGLFGARPRRGWPAPPPPTSSTRPTAPGCRATTSPLASAPSGLDPEALPPADKSAMSFASDRVKPWRDVWGAGQGVGSIRDVPSTAAVVARLAGEYAEARARLLGAAA